jgi:hypothetical protein
MLREGFEGDERPGLSAFSSFLPLAFFDGHFIHFIALADGVDDILAFYHFAKDGVFAIEMGLRRMGDEELAAVGAGASIRH